ncbi:hypothetical protein KKA23_00630 [Patescibacteria group bacterium]|nr:hypothetical protein [Patescibacteria group bacterium]MBU3923258.1 hypothetical protein [Patescibacteria group bacterium]
MEFEVGQVVQDEKEFLDAGWEKIADNWGYGDAVFQKRNHGFLHTLFWDQKTKKINQIS